MTNNSRHLMKGTLIALFALIIIWVTSNTLLLKQTDESITEDLTQSSQNKVALITSPNRPFKSSDLIAVNDDTTDLTLKRVIALEGDTVARINGVVHINGKPLSIPGWISDRQISDKQWETINKQLSNNDNRVPLHNVIVIGNNYDRDKISLLPLSQIRGLIQQ